MTLTAKQMEAILPLMAASTAIAEGDAAAAAREIRKAGAATMALLADTRDQTWTADRRRAFEEGMSALRALAETGSRVVAQEHFRRGHEVLAQAQHDERSVSHMVERLLPPRQVA